MKTFLIHDEKRLDRKLLFDKEILVQGMEVEIMPAVKTDLNVQKNISEAHKNCVRRAVADNLDRVMILEDDVKFSAPGAYNEFLRLSGDLPDDWDIFIGGSYDYKVAHTVEHGNHAGKLITKVSRFAGLHCYMVNRKFYGGFIGTRGIHNLDKALAGEIYMAWPMVALQWDGYSDNVKKVTYYNSMYANKIKLWKEK